MASELIFDLDDASCPDERDNEITDVSLEIRPAASPGALAFTQQSAGFDIAETFFQRRVKDMMLKLQQKQLLGERSAALSSCTPLKELCWALRLSGVDARIYLPAPAGFAGCGRQSTGGGGQCVAAATAGKRCFFCSRQPFAVVRQLSPGRDVPPQSLGCTKVPTVSGAPYAGEYGNLVVEPCLRELFRVAPSSPEYAALVEQLPQVWVGPRAALLELAERMCGLMALNFRTQGLDVPPWRRRASVMSRWEERPEHELPLDLDHLGLDLELAGQAQEQQGRMGAGGCRGPSGGCVAHHGLGLDLTAAPRWGPTAARSGSPRPVTPRRTAAALRPLPRRAATAAAIAEAGPTSSLLRAAVSAAAAAARNAEAASSCNLPTTTSGATSRGGDRQQQVARACGPLPTSADVAKAPCVVVYGFNLRAAARAV